MVILSYFKFYSKISTKVYKNILFFYKSLSLVTAYKCFHRTSVDSFSVDSVRPPDELIIPLIIPCQNTSESSKGDT